MAPHKPKEAELTQERLKKFLHYDPETGVFTWIEKTGSRSQEGNLAGWLDKGTGYRCIQFNYTYLAHRLAWLYMYNEWPEEIDHINRIRDDNRLDNLRAVDKFYNQRNRSVQKNSVSGITGVTYRDRDHCWVAYITVENKRINLGNFPCKYGATRARQLAELKHGFIGE